MTEPKLSDSPFQRHMRTISSALSLCETMYFHALGKDVMPPAESRMATDPLGILGDMQDALLAARERIKAGESPEKQEAKHE